MRIIKIILLLCTSVFIFSFIEKDSDDKSNIEEFNMIVFNLEKSIWSLNGYIIDTSNNYWIATDPKGYYSFEGEKRKKEDSGDYCLKLKSYIYNSDYFDSRPTIKTTYYIYGKNGKREATLVLNCGTEAFGDYPFKMKDVKVVYLEKKFCFDPSKTIIFDRVWFEENYVVTYRNDSTKKYSVDPINRNFYEIK